MDYKEQAELNKALAAEWNKCSFIYKIGGMKPKEFLLLNATAITALLARAEAAEAQAHELETAYRLEKCEDGPECAELGKARRALEAAEARAKKAESERDEYFKHLQGLCFCCAHRTDGFDCHVKCYGHKRGSAWVYAGPRKEE